MKNSTKVCVITLVALCFVVRSLFASTNMITDISNDVVYPFYQTSNGSTQRVAETTEQGPTEVTEPGSSFNTPFDSQTFGPKTKSLLMTWEDMLEEQAERKKSNTTSSSPLTRTITDFQRRKGGGAGNAANEIVVATHAAATESQLNNLQTLLQRWGGPVSVAIYISSEKDIHALDSFLKDKKDSHRELSIHIMMEMSEAEKQPPNNVLRNLALFNAESDYFVALDVDFIPSPNSHTGLSKLLSSNDLFRDELRHRRVFVLPAFGIDPKSNATTVLPTSKTQIRDMVEQKLAEPYHVENFAQRHDPTNFQRWFSDEKRMFEISNNTDFYYVDYKDGFEPYVIGYRPGIPRYWPHFRGFGNDKLSWFEELDQAGYEFGVLNNFFLTHVKRPQPNLRNQIGQVQKNKIVYQDFKDYLMAQYGSQSTESSGPSIEILEDMRHGLKTESLLSIWSDMAQEHAKTNKKKIVNSISEKKSSAMIRTITNFKERQKVSADDIVVATHLSAAKAKFSNLQALLRNWGGPVSVAVYISKKEDIYALETFMNETSKKDSIETRKLSIHIMMEFFGKTQKSLPYPHNRLRNLALQNIESDYFLALDVDFIPSKNSHSGLSKLLSSNEMFRKELHHRYVFVLPAFDIFPKKKGTTATENLLPTTKAQIRDMVKKKQAEPFHVKNYEKGHGPTDFNKWFSTNAKDSDNPAYWVRYKDVFEPYVIGYRPGIPQYWPHFRGFGLNKVSFFQELNSAGYKFKVLNNYFVCHLQHPIKNHGYLMKLLDENYVIHKEFKQYTSARYGKNSNIH